MSEDNRHDVLGDWLADTVRTPEEGARALLAVLFHPEAALPESRRAHWREQAACAGADLERFFGSTSAATPQARAEREELCGDCPAQAACRADAEQFEASRLIPGRFGWVGGTTPRQRTAASVQTRRAA